MKRSPRPRTPSATRRPNARGLIVLALAGLLCGGCGTLSSLQDLSTKAQEALDVATDLLAEIDDKVESGELSKDVADLLDGRIEKVMEELRRTLDESGGHLFDRLNGTIDRTFENLNETLNLIKKNLTESAIAILREASAQLEVQTVLLGGQVEDIITLAFGNTFILVDKATNSLLLMISFIFLGLGLVIFAVVLLRRKEHLGTAGKIGLGIAALFVLFFGSVVLVTPVRAYILKSLNFAEEVEKTTQSPKVRLSTPGFIELGKVDKITLYGSNLDKLQDLQVHLLRGDEKVFQFPKSTIVVKAAHKIVLGNLSSTFGTVPSFAVFSRSVLGATPSKKELQVYENFTLKLHEKVRPLITDGIGVKPPEKPLEKIPSKLILGPRLTTKFVLNERKNIALAEFKTLSDTAGATFLTKLEKFNRSQFKLEPGAYALQVFDGETAIGSTQLLEVATPPPPAPKPDIKPVKLEWADGDAVVGERSAFRVTLGFVDPEAIETGFAVRISGEGITPVIAPVSKSQAQGAGLTGDRLTILTSSTIKVPKAGDNKFKVEIDHENKVTEINETNNSLNQTLRAKQFIYDAEVTFTTFTPTASKDDGQDEYRIDVNVDVSRHDRWKFNYNKNGDAGNTYEVNQTRRFSGLKPGEVIILHTSGHEEDSPGFPWFDGHDGMGSAQMPIPIRDNHTGDRDSVEQSVELNTGSYRMAVKIRVTRRKVN